MTWRCDTCEEVMEDNETCGCREEWLTAELEKAKAATDEAYRQRNLAASLAARLALALGLHAGVRLDSEQPDEWARLIQIDLPGGQVAWHVHEREAAALDGLPDNPIPWDGHTPADRDARCVAPL